MMWVDCSYEICKLISDFYCYFDQGPENIQNQIESWHEHKIKMKDGKGCQKDFKRMSEKDIVHEEYQISKF